MRDGDDDDGNDDEDPFSPGPVDLEKEPDLYPPDPHRVWVNIRRQSVKEGDLDLLKVLTVCLVTYEAHRQLRWQPINFGIVKELHRTVRDYGVKSPRAMNLT